MLIRLSCMRAWRASVFVISFLTCSLSLDALPLRVFKVSEIVRDFGTLRGQEITVEGRLVRAGYMLRSDGSILFETRTCNLMMCGKDECCNACTADVSLVEDGSFGIALSGRFGGREIGCSGNECAMNCNPEIQKHFRITGLLRVEEDHGGPVRLVLEVRFIGPIEKHAKGST
ncbi:MAG TPA: hypothetical protein PLB73_11165 [Leptospiraceae bacterium]|nr:hypothetical protein [Leptospiraceae bacterium]